VYPDALRRVSYFDAETDKRLKFLTNNFTLPALTIAQTYPCRGQVELFFENSTWCTLPRKERLGASRALAHSK
jgi:hypothetical protein